MFLSPPNLSGFDEPTLPGGDDDGKSYTTRLQQETIVDESPLQGLSATSGSRFCEETASPEQTSMRCLNSTTISIPSPVSHSFASSFAFANACVHEIFVVY